MGRKKKPSSAEEGCKEGKSAAKRPPAEDSDSSDYEAERRHYDIDPDVQELASSFGIDTTLTQRLNDIMIEERQRTWEQDLARLYEILKDARTPAAMLNLKLRDMEKGTFVGKAKCGPRVRDLARKHRLDKGASSKLEEAMSMREAMGKDIEKDLLLFDEHLAASNAPSKLISMKLESLRKGFNIGHCIYSREPMQGHQGPGVDGVFNKREKRPLGYTDADLDKRFAEQDSCRSGGPLMDEATVRRMIAEERKQHEAQLQAETRTAAKKQKAGKSRSGSRGRSSSRGQKRKQSRSATHIRSSPPRSKKSARSRTRSQKRRSPSVAKRKKSRSKSQKQKRTRSRNQSPKRKASRGRSGSRKRKRAYSSSSESR